MRYDIFMQEAVVLNYHIQPKKHTYSYKHVLSYKCIGIDTQKVFIVKL